MSAVCVAAVAQEKLGPGYTQINHYFCTVGFSVGLYSLYMLRSVRDVSYTRRSLCLSVSSIAD